MSRYLPILLTITLSAPSLFAGARIVTTNPSTDAVETVNWTGGVPYSYDGSGNIRRIGNDSFVYDKVGRLVRATVNGRERVYEYDAFGNRTDCTHEPGTPEQSDCQWGFEIDPLSNRVLNVKYDARGNVEQFAGHTYTYDAVNMARRDEFGGFAREYVYTADDERIATVHAGNSWHWTVRDATGKVLREFTSSGDGTTDWRWSRDNVFRDGLLLASRTAGTGTPVTHHYHLDHLGTPRRVTDDRDLTIGFRDYFAFGPEVSDSLREPNATTLQYTGHERDSWGSGAADTLDYMHARYYSPALGRFLSIDPILSDRSLLLPQGWNRYSYALNNPFIFVDPTGRAYRCFQVPEGTQQEPKWQCVYTAEIDVSGTVPQTALSGLSFERQRHRMRERDERERLKIDREEKRVSSCFDQHRFSSVIGDLTGSEMAQNVAEFLEVGSQISLAGDVIATAYKSRHVSLGNQPYASAMNAAFRGFGRAIGKPALGRSLTTFGDKATPALAVFGAFTAAYNAATYVQCRAGLL